MATIEFLSINSENIELSFVDMKRLIDYCPVFSFFAYLTG